MTNVPNLPDYKEIERKEWTAAAPLWKKWRGKLVAQTRAATELLVREARVAPGMHALDLASGTGEPALSIARVVAAHGRVVATDLVPQMLEAIREYAAAENLPQVECRVADAEQLPFSDAEFDRVTCRFGLMFFPDIQRALGEIRRVLKPGGRFSFAVFGSAEENPFFAVTMGPFLRRAKMPPPPPDAPGIFRFADEQKLSDTLRSAGFGGVHAAKHRVPWPWPGPAEEAWQAMQDLAAPFKKVMAMLPAAESGNAVQEVFEGMRRFDRGDSVSFSATVIVATGVA